MGGCRCTYRNCSLRTDGKTHMFHYPVFDKVRCHQWLTNAHKLEFLNLKVSQLKNRVVCQHHFKDDCFMNFKKDKLTFDAVPTENGPYCDSSQFENQQTEQDDSKMFSISLDDIENEYLTIVDKKANFSVKYGDFLTNCDLMDLDSLNQINDNNQIASKGLHSLNQINENKQIVSKGRNMLDPSVHVSDYEFLSSGPIRSITHIVNNRGKGFGNSGKIIQIDNSMNNKIIQENPITHIEKPLGNSEIQQKEEDENVRHLLLNLSQVPIVFDEVISKDQNQQNQSIDLNLFEESKPLTENIDRSQKKKITIISEKKISEPVPLIGKLEPLSPTRILTFPNKRKFLNLNPVEVIPEIETNSKENTEETIEVLETHTIKNIENPELEKPESERILLKACDSEPKTMTGFRKTEEILKDLENTNSEKSHLKISHSGPRKIITARKSNVSPQKTINKSKNLVNKTSNEVVPNTSLLRNKIPPERVAAIAEKRKFNMKLRDIIEDCLDKLDDPDKSDYEKTKPSHNTKTKIVQSKKQQVGSYLAKDPELPNVQDYTIAYLDSRMKKMENILLKKIEENSQKIVDLKQSYPTLHDKKTVHTQTSFSEDVRKRQLYQELSKYLSQEANSLIYEELFINKFTQQVPKSSTSGKRRKCR